MRLISFEVDAIKPVEALRRPEPQESVRRLRESFNVARGAILRRPARVHELSDGTVAVKRGTIRACKREEKADR